MTKTERDTVREVLYENVSGSSTQPQRAIPQLRIWRFHGAAQEGQSRAWHLVLMPSTPAAHPCIKQRSHSSIGHFTVHWSDTKTAPIPATATVTVTHQPLNSPVTATATATVTVTHQLLNSPATVTVTHQPLNSPGSFAPVHSFSPESSYGSNCIPSDRVGPAHQLMAGATHSMRRIVLQSTRNQCTINVVNVQSMWSMYNQCGQCVGNVGNLIVNIQSLHTTVFRFLVENAKMLQLGV